MAIVLPKEYNVRITEKSWLSPKIIFLRTVPETPIPFQAGQYSSFLIENNRRLLSFASAPSDPLIDFIIDISPNGVCSLHTEKLEVGDSIRFLAPYGRFTVASEDTKPLLFIATGSGIAPIRGQLQDVLQRGTTQPIQLFFGNRNEEFMFLTDEFTSLAQKHSNFSFTPVLSEPSSAWQGVSGLVTTVVPDTLKNLPDWSVYVCGSPAMVKNTIAMLTAHNVPKTQIHSEQFTETVH